MTVQRIQALPRVRTPNFDSAIGTGTGEELTIGAEGNGHDAIAVSVQDAKRLEVGRYPWQRV